jgi:hypothetical protein
MVPAPLVAPLGVCHAWIHLVRRARTLVAHSSRDGYPAPNAGGNEIMSYKAPDAGLKVIGVSHPEFLQRPHVADGGTVAWTPR